MTKKKKKSKQKTLFSLVLRRIHFKWREGANIVVVTIATCQQHKWQSGTKRLLLSGVDNCYSSLITVSNYHRSLWGWWCLECCISLRICERNQINPSWNLAIRDDVTEFSHGQQWERNIFNKLKSWKSI